MTKGLETAKQSLEEISSKAKEIKDSLLPVERRIRETSVTLPKTTILGKLYEELLAIQRIAMLKSSKSDDSIVTRMQCRALFPFTVALYMPIKQTDFPYDYNEFFRVSLGSFSYSTSSEDRGPLDLLIQAQNPTRREESKFPNEFQLDSRLSEKRISEQTLRDLQYFHTLEVNKFFEDYVGLLKLIREKLCDFAEFDFKKLEERTIPVTLPNISIKIFSPGTVYQEEERRIIDEMMKSDDWSGSLEAIQSLISDVRDRRGGHLRRYRVLSTDDHFTPVRLASAPERDDIVGIDDNLRRLEALVRGYAKGRSTPNIVLLGPGGVGKTISLRYVMEATEDVKGLRYFLMGSLKDMRRLAELSDGYKPVGIIDDMRGEVDPRIYALLKQELEGLGDTLFDRALIIISANPEIWNRLDDPVKQRLGGVELIYQPNPESYEQLVRQFCGRFDVKYKPEIVKEVKGMVPRQVRDYVRALGSEQSGLESKA